MGLKHSLAVTSSLLASQARGWRGTMAFRPAKKQPSKPLELYEYEACPFGRLVREALTELDLDAMIYPCPKGGTRFRPTALELGGKSQFPFLADPNTGRSLYESADIIGYLRTTYEGRIRVAQGLRRQLALGLSFAASGLRGAGRTRGMRARPSRAPAKPLELFSFESSPYSRLVREVLCELEIPYLLHNTGKGAWTDLGPASFRDNLFKGPKGTGRNRKVLEQRTGRVQVPYLIDPNTGTEMFESADIIAYLEKTYGA